MSREYELLMLLRENTILDPVSYIKVRKERKLAEETQLLINHLENCMIGVDYSKADELERDLRFKAWTKKVFPLWYQYGDGQEVEEFAIRILYQDYNKPKKLERK